MLNEEELNDFHVILYSYFSVDFVLRDPREKDDEKDIELPPHREELAVVPKPWNKSYVDANYRIQQNLHVTNPCMNQVLDLWHQSFR
jgi:dynein heavy chain